MPEPKTAWDLTFEFGQIAVGEERWDVGIGVAFTAYGDKAEALTDQLTAIPADAAERLADAERRVGKMRHALNLVKCGMECMIREQREPLQKAIDEALE